MPGAGDPNVSLPPGSAIVGLQPEPNSVEPGCEVVDIRILHDGALIARTGWDLTRRAGVPQVDLRPLVVGEVLSGFDLPEAFAPACLARTGSSVITETAEQALATFIEKTANYPRSGYREVVLNTGVHIYGAGRTGEPSLAEAWRSDDARVVVIEPVTGGGWRVERAGRPEC